MLYIINSTLVPEAINFVVVYKPLHTVVFIKAVRYIIMYINFRSQNFYIYFFSYMDTCIAIIMYCQRLFLLFTGKQRCLH